MTGALGAPLLGHGCVRVAGGASGILVGIVLADASGSAARAGTAGAIGALGFAAEILAAVPLGAAADAIALRRLVTAGAVLGMLGVAVAAATGTAAGLAAARILEGIGSAAVAPALLAYLAAITDGQSARRARAMSLFELTLIAGLALGGPLAGILFRGLHAAGFAALAVLYGAAALVFALRLPAVAVSAAATRPFAALRAALRVRAVRRLAPIWLCVNALVGVWLGPALPFLLTRRRDEGQYLAGIFADDPARVGWLLFGYALVFAAGILLWTLVLPRIRLRVALLVSLGAVIPASAVLALINRPDRTPAQRLLAIVALALLVVVESGFTPAALTRLAAALPAAGRAGAMGVYALLLGLGELGGSLLAGLAGTWLAVDGLIAATVLLAIVALALLARLPAAEPA